MARVCTLDGKCLTCVELVIRNNWILTTGDMVYLYEGEYGERRKLIDTFYACSGRRNEFSEKYHHQRFDDEVLKLAYTFKPPSTHLYDFQKSALQGIRNFGPTVEGEYEINLMPEAKDAEKEGRLLKRNYNNGIELIRDGSSFNEEKEREIWDQLRYDWGYKRIRLAPKNVKQPTARGFIVNTKDSKDKRVRQLDSFYFHDSTKGFTSGCIEVENRFFTALERYRKDMMDKFKTENTPESKREIKIKVLVEYTKEPLEHVTNSGKTKKENVDNENY